MTTTLPSPPSSLPKALQENDLTEECRELLSTLPRERGWILDYMYQYEGFWIPARFLQGLVACQKHFNAQDSDTILVTQPKSGTTWLKALVFAVLNRSRFLDLRHHPLLTSNPHDLVLFLETTLYNSKELPDLSTFTSPRIFATHAPVGSLPRSVKDSSCKIVYLCRNPKDVFVSYWHFTNKLSHNKLGTDKVEEMVDRFCNGVYAYGPFWDHILGYWKESLENSHRVLFLKYEDIQEQPTAQLKRLAEFLKCPFSLEEEARGDVDEILKLCCFNNLSNLEVNKTGKSINGVPNQIYFREGKVGDWGKVLTSEMIEKLDRITDEKMHGSGLKF